VNNTETGLWQDLVEGPSPSYPGYFFRVPDGRILFVSGEDIEFTTARPQLHFTDCITHHTKFDSQISPITIIDSPVSIVFISVPLTNVTFIANPYLVFKLAPHADELGMPYCLQPSLLFSLVLIRTSSDPWGLDLANVQTQLRPWRASGLWEVCFVCNNKPRQRCATCLSYLVLAYLDLADVFEIWFASPTMLSVMFGAIPNLTIQSVLQG